MKEREEDFLRETKGINSNSYVSPAFNVKALEAILKAQRVDIKFSDFVFVTADPNAGGTRSRFAITSFIYDKDENMVVSILFFLLHSKKLFHQFPHSYIFLLLDKIHLQLCDMD
jgi:hypothetical protein